MSEQTAETSEQLLSDHVVLVGFGVNGRNVARALARLEVPYVVVELNPRTVRQMREEGLPVIFGDACQQSLLQQAGVERARVLAIAIADPVGARCITSVARRLNPDLKLLVRTRLVNEVPLLRDLGASEVVPEEFETALQLVALTMAAYGASPRDIEQERASIRGRDYAELRAEEVPTDDRPSLRLLLAAADVVELPLPEGAAAVGRSLGQMDLRHQTGASVVGVLRNGEMLGNPGPDLALQAGDSLFLFGDATALARAREVLGA